MLNKLHKQFSFAKSIMSAMLLLNGFVLPSHAGTTSITFHVTNTKTVEGAAPVVTNLQSLVYVVRHTINGIDKNTAYVGLTDSSTGLTTITIDDSQAGYDVKAVSPGYGTGSQAWTNYTIANLKSSSPVDLKLDTVYTHRGVVKVHVTNTTPGGIVWGSLVNKNSEAEMGFAAGIPDHPTDTSVDLMYFNLPLFDASSPEKTYKVEVFDPNKVKNPMMDIPMPLTESNDLNNPLSVSVDVDAGLPPSTSAKKGDVNQSMNTGPTTGVTVRGVVEDSTDESIKVQGGFINLKTVVNMNGTPVLMQVSGTGIEQNGGFTFNGLDANKTYYAEINPGCVPGGSCYKQWTNSHINGPIAALQTADQDLQNDIVTGTSDSTKFMRVVAASKGTAKFYVQATQDDITGQAIPGANINLYPDGNSWHTNPGTGLVCDYQGGFGAPMPAPGNPGYTMKNVNATTGRALLDGITPGNYQLQVWTPFSQTGTNYNQGTDTEFNWGPGERGCPSVANSTHNLRLTVTNNPDTVKVYDIHGTDVSDIYVQTVPVNSLDVPLLKVAVKTNATDATGTVTGTLTFPEVTDLSENPITIILNGQCSNNSNCGNFVVVGGDAETPSKAYAYQIKVQPTDQDGNPMQYWMQVRSNYWGVVRGNGGGSDQIQFSPGVTTVIKDFNFAPAGKIHGFVYKPDTSLFKPGQTKEGYWLGGSINAEGNNAWGSGEIQQDGSFVIDGLIPGTYKLVPQLWTGGMSADVPMAPDESAKGVNVVKLTDIRNDVSFINGAAVTVNLDVSGWPTLKKDPVDDWKGEDWMIKRVKAGRPMDLALVEEIIGPKQSGDDSTVIRYFYQSTNNNCNNGQPGGFTGFCAQRIPAGQSYDFYVMRKSDLYHNPADTAGTNDVYMYFANVGTLKNQTATTAGPLTLNFTGAHAIATPTDGVTISGKITAANLITSDNFDSFGGDFNNFAVYIPMIIVSDASDGTIYGAGLVTPPPAKIDEVNDQLDEAIAGGHGHFTQFMNLLGHDWRFKIQGMPAGRKVVINGSSKNYPNLPPRIIDLGTAGTTIDLGTLDWDSQAGVGGTISGTITGATSTDIIPNASITIKAKGIKRTLVSGSDGKFNIAGLTTGTYKVKVSADGYAAQMKFVTATEKGTATANFALVTAAGSISGNVNEMSGPISKPVEGVMISAYDNNADAATTLAIQKTSSGPDGGYKLTGLVEGHAYRVTARAPGRYLEVKTITATGGEQTGIDFSLQSKPLDIDVTMKNHKSVSPAGIQSLGASEDYIEVKILNPSNFSGGMLSYFPTTAGTPITAIADSDLTQLADGSIVTEILLSALLDNTDYTLRIVGQPANGDPDVTKDIPFRKNMKQVMRKAIDAALAGDDDQGDDGADQNEIRSSDNAGITILPGSLIEGDNDTIPSAEFQGSEVSTQTVNEASQATVVGGEERLTFNNINTVPGRVCQLTVPYDVTLAGNDLTKLTAYYKDASENWVQISGTPSVDPVTNTLTINADITNMLVSPPSGMKVLSVGAPKAVGRMAAMKTSQGYVHNAGAAPTGTGIFVAGLSFSTATTVAASVSYHQYNVPNPFDLKDKNITTRDSTTVPIRGTAMVVVPTGLGTVTVRIKIFNVAGEMVRELVDETAQAGHYNYIPWDGRNTAGADCASGVYFARVDAPGSTKDKPIKMVLVK